MKKELSQTAFGTAFYGSEQKIHACPNCGGETGSTGGGSRRCEAVPYALFQVCLHIFSCNFLSFFHDIITCDLSRRILADDEYGLVKYASVRRFYNYNSFGNTFDQITSRSLTVYFQFALFLSVVFKVYGRSSI